MSRPHPPKKAIAAVVVLLLVAAGAFGWWRSSQGRQDEGNVASGSVEATSYDVAPATAGIVRTVHVMQGDTVTDGQKLVELDARALDLQVSQAEQGVTAAKAALTSARDERDNGDGSAADVTAAQARVRQAEAAVSLAKVQQGYATVTAPHAGQVVTLTTNAGQVASPGRTMLTIIDPNELYARVYVPEGAVGAVRVGSGADIRTDDGATHAGTVSFVDSQAQFTPNNVATQEQRAKLVYEVHVRVDDASGGSLKPGMPADVTFR